MLERRTKLIIVAQFLSMTYHYCAQRLTMHKFLIGVDRIEVSLPRHVRAKVIGGMA
jgi:hypothetical protein